MKKPLSAVNDICSLAGINSPSELKRTHFTVSVLHAFNQHYEEILVLMGKMFQVADKSGFSIILQADDHRWREVGFADLTGQEHMLIRRLSKRCGYQIALSSNGLIVPPSVSTIKLNQKESKIIFLDQKTNLVKQ